MKPKAKVKFSNDGNPEYSGFFATLKQRVDGYFKEKNISRHANSTMVVKTIAMLSAYVIPFVLIIILQPPFLLALVLWFIMGVGLAGVGMCVMHDANHGAYSSNRNVNLIMSHTLNLLGASTFFWKLQHNVLHHTYTNVTHLDDDVSDKFLLRLSPHLNIKLHHQIQRIYALMFYGLLTFYWVLFKDFVQFVKYTRNGVNTNTKSQNRVTLTQIILLKLVYFSVVFGIPVLLLDFSFFQVLAGFLLMHFGAGIILTVTFQLAHSVEGTTYPMPNESGVIENDWAIHQLNTTVNFSPGNKWLSWYLGGLNYQVEHHLFPKISHVHYPFISGIVKQTAEDFNIPYLVNESLGQALRSHFVILDKLGRLPEFNEALS